MPLLNWLNKDEAVKTARKVPYRLLEAVPEYSHGDENSENLLIQGDNLESLKIGWNTKWLMIYGKRNSTVTN